MRTAPSSCGPSMAISNKSSAATSPWPLDMILLLDIGNTNTHVGVANAKRVVAQTNIPTGELLLGKAGKGIARFLSGKRISGGAISSVVPRATRPAVTLIHDRWSVDPLVLTAHTVTHIGVNYPKPETIGPDRLANAVA